MHSGQLVAIVLFCAIVLLFRHKKVDYAAANFANFARTTAAARAEAEYDKPQNGYDQNQSEEVTDCLLIHVQEIPCRREHTHGMIPEMESSS